MSAGYNVSYNSIYGEAIATFETKAEAEAFAEKVGVTR